MKKNKILSIGPYGQQRIGGVQYVTNMILDSSLRQKYDFVILNTNIPLIFHKYRVVRFVLTLKFIVLLFYYLIKERPQVVHAHCSNMASFLEKSLMIFIAKALFRKKTILHLHGSKMESYVKEKSVVRMVMRFVFTHCDAVIILSENFKKLLLQQIGRYAYVIIPHGVDYQLYQSVRVTKPDDGKFRLSFIGLIGARKGCYEIGQAVRILVDKYNLKNILIELIGREEDPGELEAVQTFYQDLKVQPFIHFHGLKTGEEKIKILKSSDVFILPSRHDSFGIVNLEAMAAGLPVISTRQGAIPEYLIDGENGFLIEIGDVEALARKIFDLYRDDPLRKKMGRLNQEKIAKYFSFPQIVKKYETLYNDLLS